MTTILTVTDPYAIERADDLSEVVDPTGPRVLPHFADVEFVAQRTSKGKTYAHVEFQGRRVWTVRSNLTEFLGRQPDLRLHPAAPGRLIDTTGLGSTRARIAASYNRIGGIAEAIASRAGYGVAALLGVWIVESSGAAHVPGQTLVRFENHAFFKRWAKGNPAHEALYDAHFRHGGRLRVAGKGHENHVFRERATDAWSKFHGDQAAERSAIGVASKLASLETAYLAASFGSAQVMGFNHARVGYQSAQHMAHAFDGDEAVHVLGFGDFVRSAGLELALRDRDWQTFALRYNGSVSYAPKLQDRVAQAEAVLTRTA